MRGVTQTESLTVRNSIMPLIRFECENGLVLAFLVTTNTVIAQEEAGTMVSHVDTNSARSEPADVSIAHN